MRKVIFLDNIEYVIKKIDSTEKKSVIQLFTACEDYFILTEGKTNVNTDEFFNDLPPGKIQEEKFLFGVFDANKLIAAVDLVRDYPVSEEWIIGLLLINPKYRKSGLGKTIHNEIITFSKKHGAKKLRIGVVEDNHLALKFWSKIGYEKIKIIEPIKFGEKYNRIIVMNYYL